MAMFFDLLHFSSPREAYPREGGDGGPFLPNAADFFTRSQAEIRLA
jgi:hypothetical protein